MPISDYLKDIRARVGTTLLVVPSVTGLVFDDDGRVLLVRHSNGGVWVAPGGAIDPDEAPQDAVVREVWEETGLRVEPVRLVGVFGGPDFRVVYENGDETDYVMAIYECRRLDGELRPDGEETLDARWVAASELDALTLSRWARAILPTLVARRGQTWIPPVAWRPPD
jgi:8-oxo-dGTP pyrophosphatase MutT (NUDIX family)